eukprot:2629388-Pyramimonas_sp.AAC.1
MELDARLPQSEALPFASPSSSVGALHCGSASRGGPPVASASAPAGGAFLPCVPLSEGLNVATANANSWGTLKTYLGSSDSHIALAQEHRIRDQLSIDQASKSSLFIGWKSIWAPGVPGEGGG